MRIWLSFALTLAALASGCGSPQAPAAFGPPPRQDLLQPLLASSDVADGVRIQANTWLKTYPVSATGGLAAVRRQLDRLGPISDATGQRFDALTAWGLRWSFSYDDSGGGCRVRNATIEVEAVITLPVLQESEAMPPHELSLWRGYHDRLSAHEDGHVAIYLAAARELRDLMLQTGPMPDCRSLAGALNQLGDAMIEAIRNSDRAYDAATGHGAVFP
jgi:predicted secreted Zn-dependent protease